VRRGLERTALVVAALGVVFLAQRVFFAAKPVLVRVAPVERGRVEETVTNSRAGTVKARRRAKLSPQQGGRVVTLPFKEGSRVKKGDLLLALDDSVPRAQLTVAEREQAAAHAQRDQACLAADRAERERDRYARLAQQGIVSPDILDQMASAAQTARAACTAAAATLERASAGVELVHTQLAQMIMLAPFDGVIAEQKIQVGEWTTPSPPFLPIPAVIDLIDTSSIYVSAPMDEVDSARIHAGQAARISVDSQKGRSFPGRVTRIAPYVLDVEAQNRTVEIEAELDDVELSKTLLPGTSADVEVILTARENVLRVPSTALLEGSRLLVFDGERLVERRVTTGVRNWDFTAVDGGIAEGEKIVLSLDRPEIKAGARARVEAETRH